MASGVHYGGENLYKLVEKLFCKKKNQYTEKKLTHFAKKSSEIIISSRRAGSTLQKRSLLYKTQKNKKQT
jgi:hypothetical protein